MVCEHGVAALTAAAASIPRFRSSKQLARVQLHPKSKRIIADVILGSSDTDFLNQEAIAAIQEPVLLRPWTGDRSHPLATSERLHGLLSDSVLEIQRTPDDLRALGVRILTFFS